MILFWAAFSTAAFLTPLSPSAAFSATSFSAAAFSLDTYQPTANMNGGHRRRRSSQKSQSYLYLDGEGRELNTSSLDRTEKSLVPIKDLMEK